MSVGTIGIEEALQRVGPSVGHPVAMGYVAKTLSEPGTRLFSEVRGNRIALDVHPLPFTPQRYHKG